MKRFELNIGKKKEKLPKGIKRTTYAKGSFFKPDKISIYAASSLSNKQDLRRGLVRVNVSKQSYDKIMKKRAGIRKAMRSDMTKLYDFKQKVLKKLKGK